MQSSACRLGLIPAATVLGLIASLFLPGYAFSQAPFYQGKTITINQAREPGGVGDMRVKAVIPFLQRYIPGNPTIVSEYMAGGGGRKGANHIYTAARPDGLTIGAMTPGFVPAAVLGETGVLYDLHRFIYLGSPDSGAQWVFVTRRDAGMNSLEKLRTTSGVRIGAHSVGHPIYLTGRLFAYLLDMKEPRFVTGYSGPEVDLALMRGEVDGRATIADTVVRRNPEWIEKGLLDFHAIIQVPRENKHPRFTDLPELERFAKTEKERKLLALLRGMRASGSPYILPPGTPRDRVQILQEAMGKTFKDPEYYKEYKKLTGEEATPLMPEELEKAIKELPREPEVIELFKKLAGADPLPPR